MADLGRADVLKIRDVVLQDPVALKKWSIIVDDVVRDTPDVLGIKAKLGRQDPNFAEAVLQTLQTWNSQRNGMWADLLVLLEKYELNSLAENVRSLTVHTGEYATNGEGDEEATPKLESSSTTHDNGPHQQNNITLSPNVSSPLPNLVLTFVERVSKLEELHELVTRPCGLNKSAYALLTSLYGLGGIGKTTLARRYVDYFKERFPHASIYWIESETNFTLRTAFRHLGKSLSVPEFEKMESKILVQAVYDRVHNQTCLFVFDNVTEYDGRDGIFEFLPHPSPGPQHYILATSRKADLLGRVDANDRILQLDVLNEDEADELICKSLPSSSPESRRELHTTLGRLPLALQQAIAYIFHTKGAHSSESNAIHSYLREFRVNRRKLLESEVLDEDGRKNENLKNVYVTWETTLNTIAEQEHGKLASRLLRAMAYLNPDNIELDFVSTLDLRFRFWSTLKDKSSLIKSLIIGHRATDLNDAWVQESVTEEEEKAVRAAALLLHEYSMVTLQDGIMSVHRLVQDVVRLRASTEKIVDEVTLLHRIIAHNYKCRVTQMEQCIFHGKAVVPFYNKYQRLKRCFPDFAKSVFEEMRLVEFVLQKSSSKDQAAARIVVLTFERNESVIESALTCINAVQSPNALKLYAERLSQVAKKSAYTPTEILAVVNWLIMIQETQGSLAEQILRHLPFLDRSVLTKPFLCALLNERTEIVQRALDILQIYGIDIKYVMLPTKKQIENNWGSYRRVMEYVVNHLGETFHVSSAEASEESVRHAMYLRKQDYVDRKQYHKFKESTVKFMNLVDVILRYVEYESIGFDNTSQVIKIAIRLKFGADDFACALKFIQCLESEDALIMYLDEVNSQVDNQIGYTPTEIIALVNWLIMIQETLGSLDAQSIKKIR